MSKENLRTLKTAVYNEISFIGKALSAPVRVEILETLINKRMSVEELASACEQTVANTSRHLQILSRCRLVKREKSGLNVIYSAPDEDLALFLGFFKSIAYDRLSDLKVISENFFEKNPDLKPLDYDEFNNLIKNKNVILIDVRPAAEYEKGHIPGALSHPCSGNIDSDKINILKQENKKVITYCRGPYCLLALETTNKLRELGVDASYYKGGFKDWSKNIVID
jgi:rhodanese-related sulfurtransferase